MFDPRDLDERGLLLSILQELQSIRQLLEPVEITSTVSVVAPEPGREVKKWQITLDPLKAIHGGDAFLRANPNVLRMLGQFQNPANGSYEVTYEGYFIEGAKEIS